MPYTSPVEASQQDSRRTASRNRLRRAHVLVPALLVAFWLAWTAWGGQTFANLSDVVSNDQATFLPADAESTRALELQEDFSNSDSVPAVIIASLQEEEVSEEDLTAAQDLAEEAGEISGVTDVLPPQPSDDGEAIQMTALLENEEDDDAALHLPRGHELRGTAAGVHLAPCSHRAVGGRADRLQQPVPRVGHTALPPTAR